MYFTLTGRLQTRLASLVGPFLLTCLMVIFTEKRDYWTMFWLMGTVGVLLEVSVYGWLIGYQARWVTLLLAVLEFAVLKWIVEWPYPFEIRLRTRQALEFYLLAWLLSWLTVQMILPLLFTRWAEDGGEFRLANSRRRWRRPWPETISQRRRTYGMALALLGFITLPWLVAAIRVPVGHHFTGLLLMETSHIEALAEATIAQNGQIHSLAGTIGWLAGQGRWPLLQTYMFVWAAAAFVWLVGIQCWGKAYEWPLQRLIAIAGIPLLLLPAPYLLVAAVVAWSAALILPKGQNRTFESQHTPKSPNIRGVRKETPRMFGAGGVPKGIIMFFALHLEQQIVRVLALTTLIIWAFVWLRIPSAPFALVDEGTWQALAWLRQSVPRETTITAPPEAAKLVQAFSGLTTVSTEEEATLRLTSGAACEQSVPRFRHGNVCIVEEWGTK